MENRPKRSLSLKKQGQKKLNFAPKVQGQGADLSSAPPVVPEEDIPTALPAASSSPSSSWLSGLCNLGNTCYANSILQVLRFCPHFSTKVTILSDILLHQQRGKANGKDGTLDGVDESNEDWKTSKGALVIHLHKLWLRMASKEKMAANKSSVLSATRPQQFLSKLREEHDVFDNKMQQDAQEMLRYCLTSLHETLLETLSSLPPWPAVPTTPTPQEGSDVDAHIPFGELATRKRKLPLERKSRCKISRTLRRKSASSTKVTDFFYSTLSATSEVERKKVTIKGQVPQVSNEGLDFVKEIFQGELVSQIRCYECDSRTRRTEPFLDVSLAVSSCGLPGFTVDDSTPMTPHSSRMAAREMSFVGPFSLSRVLSQFCLREKLRGENKYRCEVCGHLVEAERSVMFGHLPLVITLHLNRFSTHSMEWMSLGSLAMVNKVGGNLAIPLVLQFSSWCTEDCVRREDLYHLIAVVFHTGSSCSTGHYTACVRGKECRLGRSPAVTDWIKTDTHWVEFDDEVVAVISQEELLDKLSPLTPSTAYMLFYSVGGV